MAEGDGNERGANEGEREEQGVTAPPAVIPSGNRASMKNRSALNNAFLSIGLGSVIVGLLKVNDFRLGDYWEFLVFFVIFRIKIWLDDAKYFQRIAGGKFTFALGVFFGIVAWALWAVAGYSVANPQQSYRYCMWAVVSLSGWVICAIIDEWDFSGRRFLYLIFNAAYGVLLWALGYLHASPEATALASYALVVLTLADFLFAGSLKHFVEEK